MSGRRSRNKGKRGEREVAAIFREHGLDCKRGLQSRGGGEEQPDIVFDDKLPIHVEVGLYQRTPVRAKMRQAHEDAAALGLSPVVVWRDTDGARTDPARQWHVTLPLRDYLSLTGHPRQPEESNSE